MSPLVQAALGSILRWALAIGAGYLVRVGIWTSSEAQTYVTAGALAILALGFSFWVKYKDRVKILTALTMPADSTENDLKAKVSIAVTPSVLTPPDTAPGVPKVGAVLLACLLAGSLMACAQPPPNLTPEATSAFNKTRVIKGLDTFRDIVVDAQAQSPPLVSEQFLVAVTKYHRSALVIIHATDEGWQAIVDTALTELLKDLPANEARFAAPYVALIRAILNEVQ